MDILGQSKVLFSNAKIYAMPKFHQIYLYDLNANMLEINQEVQVNMKNTYSNVCITGAGNWIARSIAIALN